MKEKSEVAAEVEVDRVEDESLAMESRGKVVNWPKRALVPDRETEQGVRAVRDLVFVLEGVVLSESGGGLYEWYYNTPLCFKTFN